MKSHCKQKCVWPRLLANMAVAHDLSTGGEEEGCMFAIASNGKYAALPPLQCAGPITPSNYTIPAFLLAA